MKIFCVYELMAYIYESDESGVSVTVTAASAEEAIQKAKLYCPARKYVIKGVYEQPAIEEGE